MEIIKTLILVGSVIGIGTGAFLLLFAWLHSLLSFCDCLMNKCFYRGAFSTSILFIVSAAVSALIGCALRMVALYVFGV